MNIRLRSADEKSDSAQSGCENKFSVSGDKEIMENSMRMLTRLRSEDYSNSGH